MAGRGGGRADGKRPRFLRLSESEASDFDDQRVFAAGSGRRAGDGSSPEPLRAVVLPGLPPQRSSSSESQDDASG